MDGPSSQNRHRLLASLGQGGMATVYLAVSQGMAGFNKLLVIKQLREEIAEDPVLCAAFLDEARLAARLNHPNVVQTYEVGSGPSGHYIAMEYLDGQPFHAILRSRREPPLPLAHGLRILADTLAGLHHAHELCDFDGTPLHVVHRDVSPQNVFVTYDGQVKVVDFGIAKAAGVSGNTGTGVVKGKLAYMALEQARGEALDRRADIFSVGVMLWEWLAKRRMWGGKAEVGIFNAMMTNNMPSLREAAPDVPEALVRICERALSPDPAGRFATAEDFQHALEEYMDSLGPRVSPRELGRFVSEMFASERSRIRKIIEEQLGSTVSSTRLRTIQLHDETASGESSPGASAPRLPNASAHLSQPPLPTPTNADPVVVPTRTEVVPLPGPLAAGKPGWMRVAPVAALLALLLGGGGVFLATRQGPAAPAAAPAPSAPPVSDRIKLRITVVPTEARVWLDEQPLASNPFVDLVARSASKHRLRAEAPGYLPHEEDLSFEADSNVSVSLTKSPDAAAPASAPASASASAPIRFRGKFPVQPSTKGNALEDRL